MASPLSSSQFVWESKYLNPMSLNEFLKLDEQSRIKLIASTFSNYLRFGVNVAPKDEQLAEFIYEIDEALETNEKPYISVRSGHGTGKTFVLANLTNFIGLTEDDAKIVLTAPVAAQLKNQLVPELKKWSKHLYPALDGLVDVMSMEAVYGKVNQNKAVARTARKENTEALAGVHGKFVLYIVDEASGIDQKIFDVIDGALTGDRFLFVMCSNPTRTFGTFYDSHNKNKKLYRAIHLDSEKSANVKTKWVETMAEKYGRESDTFRVRVNGNFPKTSTNSLFTIEMLEKAFDSKRMIDDSGYSTFGCDIARYGNDKSIVFCRKGYKGMFFREYEKQDTMTTASKIIYEYNAIYEKPDYLFVDTIGVGAGVYDRLGQLGLSRKLIDANAAKTSTNPIYNNKRTEMYHNLADAINKGLYLPYDEDLEEELLAITYSVEPNGKIKLCSKDEIKDAIGRSPDKSDAVALTFYEILPAQEYKKEEYAQSQYANTQVPEGAW